MIICPSCGQLIQAVGLTNARNYMSAQNDLYREDRYPNWTNLHVYKCLNKKYGATIYVEEEAVFTPRVVDIQWDYDKIPWL